MCHTTLAQDRVCAHDPISIAILDERLSVCSLLLCSSLCFSACLSYPLLFSSHFYLYVVLNHFFHVGNAKVINPRASARRRSLALWSIIYLPQVMSPTSSTISTTQRPLKSSSGSNPGIRCPRTCMTRSTVTRPSAERSLHHCSLRSEKNQLAVDKLITLLKKVCCQVSLCLSVM